LIASAGFLKIDRLFLWRRQVRTKRAQGGHGQDDPVFVPVKLGILGKKQQDGLYSLNWRKIPK